MLGIHTWSTICQRGQNFPFLNEVVKYGSESSLFEKHCQNKNSSAFLGHRFWKLFQVEELKNVGQQEYVFLEL